MLISTHLLFIFTISSLVYAGNKKGKKKLHEESTSSHQHGSSYYDDYYALCAFADGTGDNVDWNNVDWRDADIGEANQDTNQSQAIVAVPVEEKLDWSKVIVPVSALKEEEKREQLTTSHEHEANYYDDDYALYALAEGTGDNVDWNGMNWSDDVVADSAESVDESKAIVVLPAKEDEERNTAITRVAMEREKGMEKEKKREEEKEKLKRREKAKRREKGADESRASSSQSNWVPVKYSICRPNGTVTIGHPRVDYSRRYGGFLDPDAFSDEEYRSKLNYRKELFNNPHYEGSHDQFNRQTCNDQTRRRAVKHLSHNDTCRGALYVPEFDEIFHHPEMSSKEAQRRFQEQELPHLYIDYQDRIYHFEHPKQIVVKNAKLSNSVRALTLQ